MISQVRHQFNQAFREENYRAMVSEIQRESGNRLDFRICETPLFLPDRFAAQLAAAGDVLLSELQQLADRRRLENAIPAEIEVPGARRHPAFMAIDLAISDDGSGGITPRLIELQGFPTTFCFEFLLDQKIRKYFDIPAEFSCYFGGVEQQTFIDQLRKMLIADCDPAQVILMEIEPETQKTRIDFYCTERFLGIKTVCITKVIQRGNRLFYRDGGKELPIKRIYNRVIFDELLHKNIPYNFNFSDPLAVVWMGHPDWFFKFSKYALPMIKSSVNPPCFFLSDLLELPDDLENYVLKPLYSFGGSGVIIDVTPEDIAKIADRENYILQRKVRYAPVLQTPQGPAKAEVRLVYFWQEKPQLMTAHVRVSMGKMMGVSFNKNRSWVGSTIAYHRV